MPGTVVRLIFGLIRCAVDKTPLIFELHVGPGWNMHYQTVHSSTVTGRCAHLAQISSIQFRRIAYQWSKPRPLLGPLEVILVPDS